MKQGNSKETEDDDSYSMKDKHIHNKHSSRNMMAFPICIALHNELKSIEWTQFNLIYSKVFTLKIRFFISAFHHIFSSNNHELSPF